MLTTESDTDKKNIAREAGATGWMVKPFDPERLEDSAVRALARISVLSEPYQA